MEAFALIAFLWCLHLSVAFPLSLPLWFFGRNRARWFKWELTIFIVPFLVWSTFSLIDGRRKSLANLVEVLWLGGAIPVAALTRVAVGSRLNRKKLAIAMIVSLSLAGALLWALVPMMPE
jgi:hypothetical protein